MRFGKRIIAIIMVCILVVSFSNVTFASETTNKNTLNYQLSDNLKKLQKEDKKSKPVKAKDVEKSSAASTLFWDTFGHGTTTTSSEIINKIKDKGIEKLGKYDDKLLDQAIKYQDKATGFMNGTIQNKSIVRPQVAQEYCKKSEKALKQIGNNKIAKNALKYGAKVLDVVSLVEDVNEYNKRKHKHASLDFLARTARGCSMVASVLAAPFKATPMAQTASKVYGVTKDALNSDTVVNTMNDYDSKWLFGLDFMMEAVNSKMISLFGGDGDEYFNSKKDEFHERYLRLQGGKKTPAGAPCYKPNIYIYPEKSTDVEVCFDYPALLTKTIPDYSGVWKVSVQPDGTITSCDGTKYGYLFYESETDIELFQREKGWYVSADSREETYSNILSKYGMNEQEIRDFNEYWTDKLDSDKDYIMYPQLTNAVDNAMPIDISPIPDNIFRIWFVFSEVNENNVEYDNIQKPEIKKFIRDGYSVIEWGGIIDE